MSILGNAVKIKAEMAKIRAAVALKRISSSKFSYRMIGETLEVTERLSGNRYSIKTYIPSFTEGKITIFTKYYRVVLGVHIVTKTKKIVLD